MDSHRRICANIDLAAIDDNINQLLSKTKDDTSLMAVIKADGYGHGALEVAKATQGYERVWGYGIATIEEALILRHGGITKPLLLLGFVFPENYNDIVDNDLCATIFTYAQAERLATTAATKNKIAKIHIAIDTGMNRIGFATTMESIKEIEKIKALPNIFIEGIFTHFARADEKDLSELEVQFEHFSKFITALEQAGINISLHHCSNSAATMQYQEANLNMVRAGISIYGLYPSAEMADVGMELSPAMSITSHVTYVKKVKKGEAIGYGGTYVAPRDIMVATIPVGYADGYARSLSNKGYVLIKGQRAPIVGRICMDQFMVDVTRCGAVQEFDEVTLLGTSDGEVITMEELGAISGRFNYEFACGINKRVPRTYKEKERGR